MIRFALRSSKVIIVVSEALKKEVLSIDPSLRSGQKLLQMGQILIYSNRWTEMNAEKD